MRLLSARVLYGLSTMMPIPLRCPARPFWGGKMLVVLPEPMSHAVLRYGYCEPDMTAMLLGVLHPGMTFFDVGAHFGYATLLGATLVGGRGQVHAFEPTPSSFEVLRLNTQKAANIFINNRAVFSRREVLTFNDFGVKASSLNSLFSPRVEPLLADHKPSSVYEVETISLDEYVRDFSVSPDVVKIDAESAELEILMGMEQIIDKAKPSIIMEVGDLPNSAVRSADLVEFLVLRQYHVFSYSDGTLEKVTESLEAKYLPGNRLFVHATRI